MKIFALVLALVSTTVTAANWQLDNSQSSLHFVSVKNALIAEIHHFAQLNGSWDGESINIRIPVSSLETQIPVRNERIWQYVLQADKFPLIMVNASLSQSTTASLAVGASITMRLPLSVTIATETQDLTAVVRVTRLNERSLQATTVSPLMLNTNSFNLASAVAKLQELAGLTRIEPLVPVSFVVQFNQQ